VLVNDVLVLCYHAVSARWPAELAVRSKDLHQQLELLLSRGYQGVTFHEAMTSPPAGKVLAVTFDEAYRSVLELAYPILSSLGIPATVFVVTDFANDDRPLAWPGINHWLGGEHDRELRGLSWSQLEVLSEAGWEIGSHSQTHRRLTQLDDATLARELRESRAACELALGVPCRSLAYPYGDFDRRVAGAAGDAGYDAAGALPPHLGGASPLTWPRLGVYRSDSMARFRLKVSPTIRRLRTIAAPAEGFVRRRWLRTALSAFAEIGPY
jgi:peptidoglycan/xylan/chitin deacetylase (PgdA/CDA1 family)